MFYEGIKFLRDLTIYFEMSLTVLTPAAGFLLKLKLLITVG